MDGSNYSESASTTTLLSSNIYQVVVILTDFLPGSKLVNASCYKASNMKSLTIESSVKFRTTPTILVSFSSTKLPLIRMSAVTRIPEQGPGSKAGPVLIVSGSPFSDFYIPIFGRFWFILHIFADFCTFPWILTKFYFLYF